MRASRDGSDVADTTGRGGPGHVVPGWLCWTGCFVLLAAVLTAAAGRIVLTSDQASLALEAQSALHGNWMLSGWQVPSDSFWLTEVPLYALAEKIGGFGPDLFRIVPALQYGLLVVLLARLAGRRERGPVAVLAVGLTLLVLGLPSDSPPYAPLNGLITEHISTLIGCVVAILLARSALHSGTGQLRRDARLWWLRPVAAVVVLALTVFDDPFAVFLVVLPTLAVAACQLWRQEGQREQLTRSLWVIGSCLIALAMEAAGRLLGGPVVITPLVHFTELGQVPAVAGRLISYLFQTSGGYFWGGSLRSAQTWVALVHTAVVTSVLWSVAATLIAWVRSRQTNSTDLLLSMGFAVTAAALLFSQALTADSQRYVLVMLLFAAPVAARRVARWAVSCRHPRLCAPVLLCGVAMAYLIGFAPALVAAPTPPAQTLATFLEAHHLTQGVATYFDASIVTLESKATVHVLPVWQTPATGGIVPQTYLTDISWYEPNSAAASTDRSFALWPDGAPAAGLDQATAAAQFGQPDARYTVDGFVIEVWNKPIVTTVYANYLSAEAVTHGHLPSLPSP